MDPSGAPSNDERERLARLFDQAPSFMAMLRGPSHVIELANPNYLKLVGHREVLGRTVADALPDAVAQGYLDLLERVYATGIPYSADSAKYAVQPTPGGPVSERYVDFVFQPVRDATGAIEGIFVEGVDSTARVLAHAKQDMLVDLNDRFAACETPGEIGYVAAELLGRTLGVSRVGFGSIDHHSETLEVEKDWCAPGVETLAGITNLRDYGSFIDSLKRNEFISIADVRNDERTAAAANALEARSARSFVNVPVLEAGLLVAVFFVNNDKPRQWAGDELELIRDVGMRTRVSVERARSSVALRASEAKLREINETLEARVAQRTTELMVIEAQYRQAQKMEAIGQLTGGIAHDFNNLLASISGSLEVLRAKLANGKLEGAERYIGMGLDSIKRAAALTQRLLAFARRQALDPKPTDVNRLIAGMEDLIRRTVGPSVAVEVVGSGGLWTTRIDPPQLEGALLNLCINARDAMLPAGGRLTIETANKWLDGPMAAERDLTPGQYVALSVSDTGCGMSQELIDRIFDPFFTTKPMGQGTGLGLSMVYGFVRQSGGQVRVYSEPGSGTTMSLYLPRHQGDAAEAELGARGQDVDPGHGETVVLIEDDDSIRTILTEVLGNAGYRVVATADGPSGLRVLQAPGRVDLLITDVGLPGGLNGRQIADAGRVSRPHLKVLFITGYAENAAFGSGHLENGMQILAKPFDMESLIRRVREMID